jgi:putative FmdB family regulatory protein
MPTYEYACTDCGERLEVVQSFSDDPLTVCPACQGKLRKLFSAVGVVFKGSGFYKTDSRSGKSKAATTSAETSQPTKSDTPTGGDSATSPAASEPATTSSTATKTSDSTGGGSKVA